MASLILPISIAMFKRTIESLPSLAVLLVSIYFIIKAVFNLDKERCIDMDRVFSAPFTLFIQTQIGSSDTKTSDNKVKVDENMSSNSKRQNEEDDAKLVREELQMVMSNLGIHCETEKLKHLIGCDEILDMFDEKEPSLEEVKEAFDVFDENRDGFIDAEELQRVLCRLGLRERSHLENCKVMINSCDQNVDGKIDFSDFVRFVESSFC